PAPSQTAPSGPSLLKDSLPVLGLVVVLAAVFFFDRGEKTPEIVDGGGTPVPQPIEEQQPPAKPLRIGVTTPHYDDMGSVLNLLGSGYQHTPVKLDELLDPQRLGEFDVFFLTCSAQIPDSWIEMVVGDAARPGNSTVR